MLNTLVQSPRPHTVMEWRYATFIEPIYNLAWNTGIFDALASGYTTVEQIAEKTGLSQRGVFCVLRCLVAVKILSWKDNHYQQVAQELPSSLKLMVAAIYDLRESVEKGVFDRVTEDGILSVEAPESLITLGIAERQGERTVLTEPGRSYFTPGQEFYLGTFILQSLNTVTKVILPHLEEIVRSGQRLALNDPKFFMGMVQTLFQMNYGIAQQLADYLPAKDEITTALDLGCGSAVWSIPLARKNSNISITAFDSAPVLERTKAYTERFKVGKQYRFLPIDCTTEDDWGKDTFDLIYLGHLCEGFLPEDNQHLIANCARYLRPGGYLVIADFMPVSDWSGPLLDVLFSIQMLCFTNTSGPYTQQAYEEWCHHADLTKIEGVQLTESNTPVLVIQKAKH